MTYEEFLTQVRERAKLGSKTEAEQAAQAVLRTLGERLKGGEPKDLASQLPPELGHYLLEPGAGDGVRLGEQDIFDLVSVREGVNTPTARLHVRAVASVLRDAVTPGEWQNVLAQLPPDLDNLFDSGMTSAQGQAPTP